MKSCPQCALEFEDETVFCTRDGSKLLARVSTAAPKGRGGLGFGPAVLSSQPISPLGATALQMPTPAKGVLLTAPRVKGIPAEPRGDVLDTTVAPRVGGASPAVAARSVPDLDVELDPSELTARHPTVSTEMRTVNSTNAGDEMIDMPTVAIKAPVYAEASEDNEPSLVGVMIAGRYKVNRRIGDGGMGVVYEAIDERLEKRVALKVLREDFARRADVVARFTQEAKSAARIKHENVLDVTDYGQTDDNSFYIAMELLVGTDLANVLQTEGVLPTARLTDISIQICRALSAAHGKGIVHRDLKPENVFLVKTDDGRELVKIVDFGIAQMKDVSGSNESSRKLTRTGMIFGTPEYMSPEQAAGKSVDHRVDVYAVGVILYEMTVGRVPFLGDTFMGILSKHMFEAPPPLASINSAVQVSADLEAVIFKAIAKDPGQRYASMQELSDDLQRLRSGARTLAALSPPPTPALGFGPYASNPAAQSSAVPAAPIVATAGVGRTVESDITPRSRSRLGVYIAVGLLVLGGIVTAVYAMSGDPPTPPVTTAPSPPTPRTARPESALPAARVPVAPAPPAAPPGPSRVHVRVEADNFPPRTSISFAYREPRADRPAIAPCVDETGCTREVLVGVPLRIAAESRRGRSELDAVPTRENEVFHLEAPLRPSRPDPGNTRAQTPRPPQAHPSQRPASGQCGTIDPATGLIRICFGQH